MIFTLGKTKGCVGVRTRIHVYALVHAHAQLCMKTEEGREAVRGGSIQCTLKIPDVLRLKKVGDSWFKHRDTAYLNMVQTLITVGFIRRLHCQVETDPYFREIENDHWLLFLLPLPHPSASWIL